MSIRVEAGDCREVLKRLAAEGIKIDAVVTDPPYHLTSIVKRFGAPGAAPTRDGDVYSRSSRGFMGKAWDGGDVAFRPETWAAVGAVMKPGAHLIAMGGTRTYHRLACAIEDAGFDIRDMVAWLYGAGFPKSHDIAKAIDRAAGVAREKIHVPAAEVRNRKATGGGRDGVRGATRPWIEAAIQRGFHEKDGDIPVTADAIRWSGWGTALKPALEPIVLARWPLGEDTIAANVLAHGTGALNIDACRIGNELRMNTPAASKGNVRIFASAGRLDAQAKECVGRWPANVVHNGSDEIVAAFPASDDPADSAARFFYSAKADAGDRLGSKHPTVKPVDLMAWLVKLVTPPDGTVLDPFAGSGTTGMACLREGFDCILIEREAEYVADIQRRLAHVKGEDAPLFTGAPATATGGGSAWVGASTACSRTSDRPGRTEEIIA